MPTLQICVWAEKAGVGVSQWAAETMGICHDKGGLTTQQIDNKVTELIYEISQSMSIINKQGASPEQWNLQMDHCVTRISDLASKKWVYKWSMTDITKLDSQKLKAALEEFVEVGLRIRKNRLDETPTMKRKMMNIGMNFIAPVPVFFFQIMCKYRRRQGRNFGSQVLADKGALGHLDRLPCRAI